MSGTEVIEKKEPTKMSDVLSNQREAIAERAAAAQAEADKASAPAVKPEGAAPKTDFQPAPQAPKSEAPAETGKPPAEVQPAKPGEPAADIGGKDKKDTHVPIGALHEARTENKSLKKENSELQTQVKTLLTDIKELYKKQSEKPADETVLPEGDYDKELKRLQTKVAELEGQLQKGQQQTEEQQKTQAAQALKGRIEETGKALEQDGFQGFTEFLPLVEAEIFRIARTEGPEAAQKVDNPEGWRKIFKETIYPKIKNLGSAKAHEDKVKEKEALKTDAGLLQPTGDAPPAAPSKEDEYTYDQYLLDRQKNSPQPQRG